MRLKKRLATPLLVAIAILATLLIVAPVLATVYSAPLAITESTGTAYTMLPVSVNASNLWMSQNGFMKSSANDTRVKTLGGLEKPHMVTDNATFTAVAVPANSQTNLYYSMGNSDLVSMAIIPGYGGYFTVADNNVVLEPSANFSISMTGFLDTTKIGSNLFNKPSAILCNVSGSGNITATIYDTQHSPSSTTDTSVAWSNDASSIDNNLASWAETTVVVGAGLWSAYLEFPHAAINTGGINYKCALAGATVPEINLDAYYGGVWNDVYSGIFTSFATENKSLSSAQSCTNLRISIKNTDVGGQGAYIYEVYYLPGISVTAPSIASGEKNINVYADSSNLTISVGGVIKDSVALGGISVTNNDNNLQFMSVAVPYLSSVNITIGGNLRASFQPTTMIIGTNLPDRATGDGVSNNGTFVWGTNPAGIAVSLASLVAASQPSPGATEEDVTRDILPPAGSSDWFGEPDMSGKLLTNPLRPFVIIMSDTTSLTERQAWTWLSLAFVLGVLILAAKSVRGHHIITGVATGAAIGACVAMTIFPIWALVFVIAAIGLGAVAERSPSL
jgi:hypothetical protein